MEDKPIAMLVTAAVVAPICALCILGPVVLGSAVAGVFSWFAGFDPAAAWGLAVIGAILAYGFLRRRRDRQGMADRGGREDELSP